MHGRPYLRSVRRNNGNVVRRAKVCGSGGLQAPMRRRAEVRVSENGAHRLGHGGSAAERDEHVRARAPGRRWVEAPCRPNASACARNASAASSGVAACDTCARARRQRPRPRVSRQDHLLRGSKMSAAKRRGAIIRPTSCSNASARSAKRKRRGWAEGAPNRHARQQPGRCVLAPERGRSPTTSPPQRRWCK